MTTIATVAFALLAGCNSEPVRDPEFATVRPRPALPAPATAGSLYRAGSSSFVLFEDTRARRVGDIVQVRLEETTASSMNAETETSKETSTSVTAPNLLGAAVQFNTPELFPLSFHENNTLSTSLESNHTFKGEGDSSQNNNITGNIAVTVAEVLPNGNLVVRGEKLFTLNQGNEYIRFSGVVRPIDLDNDNTVSSTRVADARIVYAGEGTPSEVNVLGWLARFFISAIMPF